ncbi:MAG: FapA family protein, partial [Spirochaetota bacterium]|nr:FapA family protein [Spirochaetota bacterium]
ATEPFHEVLDNTDSNAELVIGSISNIVGEGSVVAKVIEFDDEKFNSNSPNMEDLSAEPNELASELIFYNSKTKEFISRKYGFVALKDKKIVILPLVQYTENKLKGYLYVYPTINKQLPTLSEIKNQFDFLKIIHSVEDFNIKHQIDILKNDPNKIGGRILIAEGVPPEDGVVQRIELKKKLERSVGKELDDGRIDYKEKQYFYTVDKEEIIAEKIPEIPPKDGVNIFGETIKGELKGKSDYKLGKNLIPEYEGSNIYLSTINGVIDIGEDTKINVEERLLIKGDVNLNTGNVHFPGIVEVSGSIQRGFTVEATRDIIVNGNVEDATVKTNGKLIVYNGILGKEFCKVYTKEGVEARFVQNAEIKTERDLIVSESIIQGRCFAKGYVKVEGHIIGGEILGLHGIEVGIAGSASETKTILTTGKDPEVESKIDQLNTDLSNGLNELKEQIDEITQYFGENILAEVKTVINTLPTHRKKKLLSLLQAVKDINTKVQKMKIEKEILKKSLLFDTPPYIKINEEAFPDVTIKVRDSVKKIENKINSKTTFREDKKTKLICID